MAAAMTEAEKAEKLKERKAKMETRIKDLKAKKAAGTLNDKLRGFYRSTFTDDSGVLRTIATTQMQATDCRRAFPCFDEPDFKAEFIIILGRKENMTSLSLT